MTAWLITAVAEFLLAAGGLPQEPGPEAPRPVVEVPSESAPVVDGDLGEWRRMKKATVSLTRRHQVWQEAVRGDWGGPDDLSAEFYLAYDQNHLYLAGRVRDNSLVVPAGNQSWHLGDAVEVFLDLDLQDDIEAADRSFGEDDLQIFLMPLNEGRPSWGVMDYGADPPRPGSLSMTGFEVAGTEEASGYRFEAAIPFHNLAALPAEVERIGFSLALDDHDEGTSRYQYMTWTGTNPVTPQQDTRRMGQLVFGGPAAPLSDAPEAGLPISTLLEDLPYLLVPLLGALALIALLRVWSSVSQGVRWLRPTLLTAGILLFAAGLLVPGLWMEWRDARRAEDLRQLTGDLQDAVAAMERGTLASYRGAQRDRALIDLLRGREIPARQFWEHRPLVELVEEGFGAEPQPFPGRFFRVLPYWIPLPRNEVQHFDVPESLQDELLYVVVARPAPARSAPMRAAAPRLRVNGEAILFDLPFEDAEVFGRSGWEVTYEPLEVPTGTSAVTLAAADGDDLVLVGLNLGAPGEEARPLLLGQASLGGVETDLRGPYPDTAGVELAPGQNRIVQIPAAQAEPFEKLWLFYRAEYPGSLDPVRVGAKVAQVTVGFHGEEEPRVIELHHQMSMLFELDRHNSAAEDLSAPVQRAFEWEDEERERHVILVYELDLPEGATVSSLAFESEAPYRIRFRSAVFGSPKPAVGEEVGDSPLVWSDTGGRLGPESRQELRGAEFAVYREGRVSESTIADADRDRFALPGEVRPGEVVDRMTTPRSGDPERIFETYDALSGDGWQGATLGVFLEDADYVDSRQRSSLLGLVLLLLSAPVLLVLFSDGLSRLGNLRLRLIGVLSAAILVPLGLLSVILVGVLERGHEADVEQDMMQRVIAAGTQLEEQGRRLKESADGWLESLISEPGADNIDFLEAELQNLIDRQLPTDPNWDGSYLQLDFVPDPETPVEPFTISAGASHLAGADTPFRQEPGVYLTWGTPLLGVTAEQLKTEGRYSLTAGRPLNAGLLGALAPDRSVLLMDTRGYPLAAAEAGQGGLTTAVLEADARRSSAMSVRREIASGSRGLQPVVQRQAGGGGSWLVGYDVLRDAQETPRAVLALVQPDERATLELPVGRVPVRVFFMLAGGLMVLLSVFLSFLVTSRISRPIEHLESGARALADGELDVQVVTGERGEIGRLTETFNRMAQELRGRVHDLSVLNEGIQDVSSSTLDLEETVANLRRFCAAHSPARDVRVALLERERNSVELHGDEVETLDLRSAEVRELLSATGPFSIRLRGTALAAVGGAERAVVLPMVLGGRAVGAIVLLFGSEEPAEVNLELLSTVASQAATAVVNAQLYRHASRDPYTGAYMPDHFRQRVAQEVAGAQEQGGSATLLGIRLRDPDRVRDADPDGFGRLLEGMATQLQEQLPDGGFLCHRGDGQFEVLLPAVDVAAAHGLLEGWLADLSPEPVIGAMARYPEDAVSAEFLFDALGSGLATVDERWSEEAPALESTGVIPRSPGMREVYLTLRKIAPTDLTILLEGETGTGKEVLTDNIHMWSSRSAGPLVKVNCAALSETLLQSELFGHEKGAFTGATGRKIGRFELAQGGTIFLDEASEISLEVQVQLLRVLQEREIDRVGGTKPVHVDVRVIAATNRDLVEMVREGRFREDLYYRLQGMVVRVPPLRERKQEIPSLVEHFRREAVESGHTRVQGFSAEAMDELFCRDWPGNIRELRNASFRAMVLAAGPRVELADLMGTLAQTPDPEPSQAAPDQVVEIPRPEAVPLQGRLATLHALVETQGSVSAEECAARLGVSPRTGLRDLQDLVARGLLERVGKRRGARYRLVEKA